MTISTTLDKTVRLYRANFVPLLAIGAVGAVATLPLALLDGKPHGGVTMSSLGLGLFGFILFVGMLLFVPWQYGAMMSASLSVVAGDKPRLAAALQAGLRRLRPLALANLLGILAGVVALPLFIFPAFFIWLGFSFAIAAIMEADRRGERIGGVAALRRSWALTGGLRGRIFGLYFVLALLHMVVSFALGGLLGLVGIDGLPRDLARQMTAMFVNPCYGLSLALLFVEARSFREGEDLALMAERLGAPAPSPGGVPAV